MRRASMFVSVLLLAMLVAPAAHAVTDRWAAWSPFTGTSNDYATTMRQQSSAFPEAAVATDSRSNVQLAAGVATFLGPGTPPGAKYGSSQGSPYVVLRARADNATAPSTTTYTFANPTPDTGWAFVLGDIDSDQVAVRATDELGDPVSAAAIDGWFQGTFNYAGGPQLPVWDPATSTLGGAAGNLDTNGASGWFEPDIRLSSLTLVFTRRVGFPVYQTWFVSRARPIGGTVTDVSTVGSSCPIQDATVSLVSPYDEVIVTVPVAADGTFSFGEFATQSGYVVRLTPPETCAVVGDAQVVVSNRGNDNDPASRADFDVRQVVPQPISGTVRDTDGNPVAGVEVTLDRPDGSTAVLTTAPDGTYLFDVNPVDTGYTLTLTVPPGYAAGPGGTTITGIDVATTPITDQDFVVRALASVSGTVTGGGNGLGGVQVVLTPDGGGPPLTTVTQGDGRYVFEGLPAGGYTVEVVPPDGYSGGGAQAVTVAAGDLTGIDFALTRPGAVAGQVTDADTGDPLAGVEVVVDGPGGPTTTTTDAAGSYYVDGLTPGDYTASVTPPAGTEVVGPQTRPFTITPAGEIRGGSNFRLAEIEAPAPQSPSGPPTSAPTQPPSGGPGSDTGTLPQVGGPSAWLVVLGGVLLVAGAALIAASRRSEP